MMVKPLQKDLGKQNWEFTVWLTSHGTHIVSFPIITKLNVDFFYTSSILQRLVYSTYSLQWLCLMELYGTRTEFFAAVSSFSISTVFKLRVSNCFEILINDIFFCFYHFICCCNFFLPALLNSLILYSTEVHYMATKGWLRLHLYCTWHIKENLFHFHFSSRGNKWEHISSAPKSASSGLLSPWTTSVCVRSPHVPISTASSAACCWWGLNAWWLGIQE